MFEKPRIEVVGGSPTTLEGWPSFMHTLESLDKMDRPRDLWISEGDV